MRKQVTPKSISANGLWNPWTRRKRFSLECGDCDHTYDDKIPIMGEAASSLCPCCGAQNKFSLAAWLKLYESNVAAR